MYGDPSEPAPEVRAIRHDMPHYSRAWHFDPYHQLLSFAKQHGPAAVGADTEWTVWEVFQQEKRGDHHKHVGSLHAPDPEMALVLAKENYARRGECVNLWVVPGDQVFATDYEDADVFVHTTDKNYREPAGYQGLRRTKIHGFGRDEAEAAAVPEEDETELPPKDDPLVILPIATDLDRAGADGAAGKIAGESAGDVTGEVAGGAVGDGAAGDGAAGDHD